MSHLLHYFQGFIYCRRCGHWLPTLVEACGPCAGGRAGELLTTKGKRE